MKIIDIELIHKAIGGNHSALDNIMRSIKDDIYNLSLRMLWNPADAEDATQEILIKIFTNLSTFRNESKFSTWAYKIATNHLLTLKRKGSIEKTISFEQFADELSSKDANMHYDGEIDQNILVQEIKIGCTHAMLLCLKREYRLAYILDTIFKVNSNEGAAIMEITPETFRKRLSRAREKVKIFMKSNCGLANPANSCRCENRINTAIKNKRMNPNKLLFVNTKHVQNSLEEIEKLDNISKIFYQNPYYHAPEKIITNIKNIIDSKKFNIINL